MASLEPTAEAKSTVGKPTGRRRRAPASGAERARRDAWALTWAPAGREVRVRLEQERAR